MTATNVGDDAGPYLETVARRYLRTLWHNGYFAEQHTSSEWTWIEEEPACRDDATYKAVRGWLEENGLIHMHSLSYQESQAAGTHPKDWNDAWWLEITAKGRAAVA